MNHMDKAERYGFECERNLHSQFVKLCPPKHPNLPSNEQYVLTSLYTGFRLYFLENKDKIGRFDYMDTSWSDGFLEVHKQDPWTFRGMGYYKIENGHISTLYIGKRFLGTLPSEIGQLTSLQELFIRGHSITNIFWSSFNNLTHVQLKDCNLSSFPVFFEKSENLIDVDISSNNISTIPTFIGNWKHCESFRLDDCKLTEIPAIIGNLCDLGTLSLRHNSIERLPNSIGNCKKLNVVNVSQNEISVLPRSIKKSSGFFILDISYNNFTSLPDFLEFIDIRILRLSGNPFLTIPRCITNKKTYFSLKINNTPIRSLSGLPPILKSKFNKRDHDTGSLHPDGLINPSEYYAIPTLDLARRYAIDSLSLSDQEKKRLQWEGGFQERSILESASLIADSVLMEINKRLQIQTENGFYLLL